MSKKHIRAVSFVCEKCGKLAEANKEKSNQNWQVFDNKPCECGGNLKIKVN